MAQSRYSATHPEAKQPAQAPQLRRPITPDVTLLGPGPLTSWEMTSADEKAYWQEMQKIYGFGSYKATDGIVHRNGGVRRERTTGARGLFKDTVKLLKKVVGLPDLSKVIFVEGGHNAASIGHANIFAAEPEVPVVAICNGGFSGDVWGKDLKNYEAVGALKKVILVTVPDGQAPTVKQVQDALRANGVQAGAAFNITFTSSETSTSVMIPKQVMIDILNIPGRKRALIDASSGLMVHEIPGIDGVGANGRTKDGLTRGVSFFATGQKGLRLATDYCAFVLCQEDLDVIKSVMQPQNRATMSKAIRIDPAELDAENIKRSSRVRGCLEAHYGLSHMRLMQERGYDHIQIAKTRSMFVRNAVGKNPLFSFYVGEPDSRGSYNIVILSQNKALNALSLEKRAAVMQEAHELLADEGLATDVKPYGNRGDFRFTTLDIASEEQAKITLDAFAYAVNLAIVKMKARTINLIAEAQFLYPTSQQVEAAIVAKRKELAAKNIKFIDARSGWGSDDRDYTLLPEGNYVIYKPQLQGKQIADECDKIRKATLQKTAIIVAAKTVPPEARFDIYVRQGAGVNNIPREQAQKDGSLVINCPGVNSKVTSDNTLNALAGHAHIQRFCTTKIATSTNLQPLYDKSPPVDIRCLNRKIIGKVVAVLGAGDIGTQTILRLLESDAREVRVYSRSLIGKFDTEQMALLKLRNPKFKKLVICDSVDDAMRGANFAINHLALVKETENIVKAAHIASMASGAEIIDASRPGVIEPNALIAALKTPQLSRAVVDFDTPEKDPNNQTIAKLFRYSKEAGAKLEYSPHAFADTCADTRNKMLDMALLRVVGARLGHVHNFAGLGDVPKDIENLGTSKPAGIVTLKQYIQDTLQQPLLRTAAVRGGDAPRARL